MKKSAKVTFLTALSVVLVLGMMMLFGCGSSSSDSTPAGPATLASITVAPATAPTVTVGNTQQFTATALMSDGTATSPVITWSTSSTAIATIGASTGLATAVAAGPVTVTATSGSVSGTRTMTVVAAPVLSGTLYQASQNGGHIAVYSVTIDPTNTTSPITVNTASASKIQLNGAPSQSSTKTVFHDIRFDDATNPTKIYYSAIMSRPVPTSPSHPNSSGVADIGYVDLTQANTAATNNGINSVIDIDYGASQNIAGALSAMAPEEFGTTSAVEYCASGMDKTNGYYLPMSMSFPAYLDAVPLAKLNAGAQGSVSNVLASGGSDFTRTYIWQIDHAMDNLNPPSNYGQPPLAFIHGGSSPDGSKVYMVMNVVSGLSTTNNLAGFLRTYLVNASDLESASTSTPGISTMTPEKVLSTGTVTVAPSDSTTSGDGSLQGTIAYRATFTPNGNYILQSGSDRLIILNASDLSVYSNTGTTSNANSVSKPGAITTGLGAGTYGGIEVHDVISTPDSKYAILSLRYYTDQTQAQAGGAGVPGYKTSGVQLYDINNKAFIGNVTPTCGSNAGQCHVAAGDVTTRATCGVLFKKN